MAAFVHPSGIDDSSSIIEAIGIIGTRGTVGVFRPAPFGVVDVLETFNAEHQNRGLCP